MKALSISIILLVCSSIATFAQVTDTITTFTFSNTTRSGVFQFPTLPPNTYSKIKMLYRMRCKNAQVSTTSNRNLGCGEWDYSCNTYLTDSSSKDSLKATHPDHVISGFSGTSFPYKTGPTHTFTEYKLKNTIPGAQGTETPFSIGNGTDNLTLPFAGQGGQVKAQYLLKAQELQASGLSQGPIHALEWELAEASQGIRNLRIRMRAITDTALTQIADTNGLKEVYWSNVPVGSIGSQKLLFYQPFTWNGTSNVVVEISYAHGNLSPAIQLKGHNPAFNASVVNGSDDRFLEFDGTEGQVSCGDIAGIDSATAFSFEAWVNIKSWKNWQGIFKDNGRVVLETGDSPGALYCIIRNPNNTYGFATNVIPLNTWTHVAMVFDGTKPTNAQKLKLYINGVQKTLTYSGTLPNRTEPNKTPLVLARGIPCRMDEARVWGKALDGNTILNWFRKKANSSHPDFPQLLAAYNMDEGSGETLNDASSFQNNGTISGSTMRRTFNGHQIFKNLDQIAQRPNIKLIRASYPIQFSESTILDSIPNLPNRVVRYQIIGGNLTPTDTLWVYQAGQQDVQNPNGVVIRTIPVAATNTISINTLNYYAKSPQKVELLSFVTPYGIGINFGTAGKVWEFDVTDFVHQLRGPKRLSLERGGEYQEEMDIRFVFYHGTPPRNVLSLTQLWPVTASPNADILNNKVFEERSLVMHPQASTYKIRSAITGHGQEGEFIPRSHSIRVNSPNPTFQWDVWKGCGLNPVFPQGGTWVYDRAGWCPGAPTDVQEWVPTNLQAGNLASFDYTMAQAGGDSRYIVSHQLVQYGPANFTLDAGLLKIATPSGQVEFGRRNPSCMNPVVNFRNEGSTPLTTLTFEYGFTGQQLSTYTWNGNLAFMSTAEVTLPWPSMGPAPGTFQVRCLSPNGLNDQNGANDSLSSAYQVPLLVPSKLVIEFKSNLRPEENGYEFKTYTGDILLSQNNFETNTIYRDTLDLSPGCYEFLLTDEGQDGLNWWANTSQGVGYIRLKNGFTGATIRTFNPDFGGEVYQQVFVQPTTANDNLIGQPADFEVYPNPTEKDLNIQFAIQEPGKARLELQDLTGRVLETREWNWTQGANVRISMDGYAPGVYLIRLNSESGSKIKRIVLR